MLRGSSPAKVDDKGRFKLPTVFRAVIEPEWGREFFVTSLLGDSVRIYPLAVYSEIEQRVMASSAVDARVAKLRRALNYFGQPASMDRSGRIAIHPMLRQHAGIDKDITVLGSQNFVEVWDTARFVQNMKDDPLSEADLAGLADLGI